MKITCLLINPVHTANRTKHCDPPQMHTFTPLVLLSLKEKSSLCKRKQKQLKITTSTQQCLVGFCPTAVSQILNICKEFYELQMLSTYYRHTPGQRLLEERKQLRHTSEMGQIKIGASEWTPPAILVVSWAKKVGIRSQSEKEGHSITRLIQQSHSVFC